MLPQQGILPPKLQGPIENIIKQENFTTYSIDVKNIEEESNFFSVLREVIIKGETENGSKELKLFTKTIVNDLNLDIYISSFPMIFKNETYMYNEFGKIIYDVQEEAKIPVEEKYTLAKSFISTDVETIIMENLSVNGFVVSAVQEVMPLKLAELAIQQLAKFHSFAFILKERRPHFFNEKVKKMKQPFFYGQKVFIDFVKKYSGISMNCLNPEQKEKIEKFLPTTFDKYENYVQDPSCTWTLVHGDFRTSNVMAKFDENGEAFEVKIIDYQHSFYGCSVIDLIYFLVSASDQEFRRNHMDNLKTLYYESMERFLKLFNMDIEKYYKRKEFERLYKDRLDFGLMTTFWLLPIVLANKNDPPGELSDLLKKRIQGIVDDYIQWGYI